MKKINMKYKISLKEWEMINKFNYANKRGRHLCTYYLYRSGQNIIREQRICLFLYLLLFIPAHIIQVFILMWDGGLKEFEFAQRLIGYDVIYAWDDKFKIAEEILKQHNN